MIYRIAFVLIMLFVGVCLVPYFVTPTVCSSKNACIANLKIIDGAKATWALEKGITNNEAMPAASDLFGSDAYIRDEPVCEQGGGVYTIGNLMVKPKCSIPQHSLDSGNVYVFDEFNHPLCAATVCVLGAVSNRNAIGYWDRTWTTTDSNGLGYVNYSAEDANGFAAFKEGYSTNSLPLRTTWPAILVLKKL